MKKTHRVIAFIIIVVLAASFLYLPDRNGFKGGRKLPTSVVEGSQKYIRHPQYLGLIVLTIGLMIQWPTIITPAMWPMFLPSLRRKGIASQVIL